MFSLSATSIVLHFFQDLPANCARHNAGVRGVTHTLRPVYSDTTQRRVELSCVGEVSIVTPMQLNVELRRYKWALSLH